MMSSNEEYLSERVEHLESLLLDRSRKLETARETVEMLEKIVHKAAVIAGHLPYLCAALPEVSNELDQAAAQLQHILVHRNP